MLGLRHVALEGVRPSDIAAAGTEVCRLPWEKLLLKFPGFMPYRAQRACFGAAYIFALLTDVYGLGPDVQTTFAAVESRNRYELSWALGAAVRLTLQPGALKALSFVP